MSQAVPPATSAATFMLAVSCPGWRAGAHLGPDSDFGGYVSHRGADPPVPTLGHLLSDEALLSLAHMLADIWVEGVVAQ